MYKPLPSVCTLITVMHAATNTDWGLYLPAYVYLTLSNATIILISECQTGHILPTKTTKINKFKCKFYTKPKFCIYIWNGSQPP